MSPIFPGVLASGISGHLTPPYSMSSNFESIATATVTSGGQNTITFSSIPQTYKHLQIRAVVKDSRGTYGNDYMFYWFNGDNASSRYSWHLLAGDGSGTPGSGGGADFSQARAYNIAGTGAWAHAPIIIDILDYTNTNKYKTARSISGIDLNGTVGGYGGILSLESNNWRKTEAITSITFDCGSQPFQEHTKIALYGVK